MTVQTIESNKDNKVQVQADVTIVTLNDPIGINTPPTNNPKVHIIRTNNVREISFKNGITF